MDNYQEAMAYIQLTAILAAQATNPVSASLTDPGVPIVYAGFGALMLTTCISYLSHHAQIWALQDGTTVYIGGKTNRAKGEFPDKMNHLLDQVPELVPPSTQLDNIKG